MDSWENWETVDPNAIQIPGLDEGGDKEDTEVKTVAFGEEDEEDEGVAIAATAVPESQPKNEDKVRGLQPIGALRKKTANKAKQNKTRSEHKAAARAEMTPAQLKARQRELEENSDMMAAADTFGFDVSEPEEEEEAAAAAGDFFELDKSGGKEAYAGLAARLAARLLEFQGDAHYMHLVTELAKNLSTSMSVEEIADVVASMEVVKNAKRTVERGGNKKKKKGPAVKMRAVKEDFVEDEYADFI